MSSQELTAWFAYEQANGPLGGEYDSDMLAQINYQLQRVVAAVAASAGAKAGDIPEPKQPMRPPEVMERARQLAKEKAEGVGAEYRSRPR